MSDVEFIRYWRDHPDAQSVEGMLLLIKKEVVDKLECELSTSRKDRELLDWIMVYCSNNWMSLSGGPEQWSVDTNNCSFFGNTLREVLYSVMKDQNDTGDK